MNVVEKMVDFFYKKAHAGYWKRRYQDSQRAVEELVADVQRLAAENESLRSHKPPWMKYDEEFGS